MSETRASSQFDEACALHQAGHHTQAEALFRRLLLQPSEHGRVHHQLGVLLLQTGRPSEAVPMLHQALEAQPGEAQYWISYIEGLLGAGRADSAQRVLTQACQLGLSGAVVDELALRISQALSNEPDWQAIAPIEQAGDEKALEASLREVLAQHPEHPRLMQKLGVALLHQRKDHEALQWLERAAEQLGDDIDLLNQRALVLNHLGRYDQAHTCYLKALEQTPDNVPLLANLADNLSDAQRHEAAIPWLQRALMLEPRSVAARANMANALLGLKRHKEAWDLVRELMAEEHYTTQILLVCARLLVETDEYEHAEAALRRALMQKPDDVTLLRNLTVVLGKAGRAEETLEVQRRLLELLPDDENTQGNLLFGMNYSAKFPAELRVEEARRYGEMVSKRRDRTGGKAYHQWRCEPKPQRLRVGVVSGDLHQHPVGYFLLGLISQLDLNKVELIAYSTWPHPDDQVAAQLRPHFAKWVSLVDVHDQVAAERIHEDAPHVLIDLAGHTAYNRLPMFAWRPAPVQVSWLGYFATTGVAEIDWILADETGVPEKHRSQFVENVWYLPDTRLCFTAPEESPDVSPLPALETGYVTFGSFQNLSKVSDDVLRLWSQVMARVPQSRLRLQTKAFYEEAGRTRILKRLARFGIEADRVSLHPSTGRQEYLAAHAEVDLILDTFPYPGGTTTCEALWMGVPTVTLAGDSLIARQGASLLAAADLNDWIAESHEAFISKAVSFASDLEALSALRSQLRAQVACSPLFDGKRFALNLQEALWGMWKHFCQTSLKGPAGKRILQSGKVRRRTSATPAEMQVVVSAYASGKFSEAEEKARKLLARYPGDAFGWKALGVTLRAQGKQSEGIAMLRKATALAPDDAESFNNLGHALHEAGCDLEAIGACQKAVDLAPGFAEAHLNLAVALQAKGFHQEALKFYERAAELKPVLPGLKSNIGVVLKELGRYDEAVEVLEDACAVSPTDPWAHNNLAR